MENFIIEKQYPISFREEDAKLLGNHLKSRHSVMLVGMKRVGISNFLRFFLNHNDIVNTYINDGKKHLFIPVNFDDLIERELFPFWTLTLKRIVDAIDKTDISKTAKKEIENLFLTSIQSQDQFLTTDSVRKALHVLIEHDIQPTLFFLRFDRLKDVATPSFFSNLHGLNEALHYKLSFVFTSYRSMQELVPWATDKASLSVFLQDMYIKPAKKEDMEIVFTAYKEHYKLSLSSELEQALFDIIDGYVQYLQLALIALHEHKMEQQDRQGLLNFLLKDERITLQSEELWESLTPIEQTILLDVSSKKIIDPKEKQKGKYLWDTGLVKGKDKAEVFSPLFADYLAHREKNIIDNGNGQADFTKKELSLFTLLQSRENEICEREEIITAVWPEVETLGISDWAIDRLVARVRNKLRQQKSNYEIQTIKTRGYKLIVS